MLILSLGGCSSLPSSGPTADDITAAQSDTAANGFRVEDITANTITTQMGELSPAQANLSGLKLPETSTLWVLATFSKSPSSKSERPFFRHVRGGANKSEQ